MLDRTNHKLRSALILAPVLLMAACGANASDSSAAARDMDPEVALTTEALLLEAKQGGRHEQRGESSLRKFQRDLIGIWRAKEFQQGAWIDLIWVIGKEHAWHVVAAYADEALTIPLLRWDVVRSYELGAQSKQFASARDLSWTDEWSSLLAYVDNPGLFTQVGVSDCELVPGVLRDTSTDNCGAPLFPFRECELRDFVELTDGQMTFGDPTQGDRCEQRPTRREAWSFERAALTPELTARLLGR